MVEAFNSDVGLSVTMMALSLVSAMIGVIAGALIAKALHVRPIEPIEKGDGELSVVLHQSHEFSLRLLAQNSKLNEQLLAICDPKGYAEYRKAATLGVPPGSIQPLPSPLHAAPPRRHDEGGSAAVERAVERVVRDVARESGLPIPVANPSDIDRGSGLP